MQAEAWLKVMKARLAAPAPALEPARQEVERVAQMAVRRAAVSGRAPRVSVIARGPQMAVTVRGLGAKATAGEIRAGIRQARPKMAAAVRAQASARLKGDTGGR